MKIISKWFSKYMMAAILALGGLGLAGASNASAAPWGGTVVAVEIQPRPVVVRYEGWRSRRYYERRWERRHRDRDDWRWRDRDDRRWRDRDDYRR